MMPSRTFEDLSLGEARRSQSRTITQDEIISFAKLYDPQWFHADAELAKASVFGGVVASGIHVLALWRQMDHDINSDIDFVCGVGFDDMRLKKALRPGDTIHVTSEIIDLKPSSSGKQRGTARTLYKVINQHDEELASFISINLVYTRAGRERTSRERASASASASV